MWQHSETTTKSVNVTKQEKDRNVLACLWLIEEHHGKDAIVEKKNDKFHVFWELNQIPSFRDLNYITISSEVSFYSLLAWGNIKSGTLHFIFSLLHSLNKKNSQKNLVFIVQEKPHYPKKKEKAKKRSFSVFFSWSEWKQKKRWSHLYFNQ